MKLQQLEPAYHCTRLTAANDDDDGSAPLVIRRLQLLILLGLALFCLTGYRIIAFSVRFAWLPRCLFIVSTHAPTNCSFDAVKDSFYEALGALLQRAKSSDIVVVAGDMNAQVGKLNADEAQLGGCLGLDSVRKDNGERLL